MRSEMIDPMKGRRVNPLASLIAMAVAMGVDVTAGLPKDKPVNKCRLSGCATLTTRDYCCAEHYREAKRRTAPGAGKGEK